MTTLDQVFAMQFSRAIDYWFCSPAFAQLRFGELVALRRGNIDLDKMELRLGAGIPTEFDLHLQRPTPRRQHMVSAARGHPQRANGPHRPLKHPSRDDLPTRPATAIKASPMP